MFCFNIREVFIDVYSRCRQVKEENINIRLKDQPMCRPVWTRDEEVDVNPNRTDYRQRDLPYQTCTQTSRKVGVTDCVSFDVSRVVRSGVTG